MKKLFKTLALTLALVLPFAAMAQEEAAKTTIKVGGDAESPNIAWTITAEEEGDGIFVITFDGAIAENGILTHNHPENNPFFSKEDINSFVDNDLHQMRATTSDNGTFSIKRSYGRKQDGNGLKSAYEKAFSQSLLYGNKILMKCRPISIAVKNQFMF